MSSLLQLWRVTPKKTVAILGFVVFSITIYQLPFTAHALSLSYPSCSPAIQSEIEAKLKEKIPETVQVTECVATEEGYAFRFRENDLVISSGTHYELHRAGEATPARDTFTVTNGVPRAALTALLDFIESQTVYTETISSIQNPFRYVTAVGGIVVGIESRGLNTRNNLFFSATGNRSLRAITQTSAGSNPNATTISISTLGLAFTPVVLTRFSYVPSLPPPPPPPGGSPPPSPPVAEPPLARISNPAFALCSPATLRAVVFGERNDAVANLQHCLIGLGYAIPAGATGYYGNQTVVALKRFYFEQANYAWHGLKFGPLGIQTMQRIGVTAR